MSHREDEAERLRYQIENEAQIDDRGCLRWTRSGNPVPPWTWEDAYGEPMPARYRAEYDRVTAEFLEEYRANDAPPSDEEMFEMRAAFGEGETVVNVITGRKTRL
jgi:hypothetical protein